MFIDDELKDFFAESDVFEKAFAINGEVFRNVKNRKTMRFSHNGKNYFVKLHKGVGWKEIFKCLSMFKRPVLGAENEYMAIRLLEILEIPTMKCRAFAKRGTNPAKQESFIITDELQGKIPLEDFCRDWKTNPPPSSLKNRIIDTLAMTCAQMHFAGMNHRDCYICHFLLDEKMLQEENKISLCVLDLHRAEIRARVPRRLQIKDVAGIFFSSMDAGLKKRDALRFIAVYSKYGHLDPKFWGDVLKTAVKLYRKEWNREPELG